ncbi:uncharacterized protein LOC141601412 [Silene latifolia]|uniref:uncharacterized protein LOC141601412 n=1 Tax=Silene latifolia TaxID=37657 RepID=UPI003D786C8C
MNSDKILNVTIGVVWREYNKQKDMKCWDYVTNITCHPGGRIWLLWQPRMVFVDIIEMSDQLVHVKLKEKINNRNFYATFVYGFNKVEERVCKKLKLMKPVLKNLNCSLFSDIERNADIAYKIMIEAQIPLQIFEAKAKCAWERDGDANTAMFHRVIRKRRLQNKVLQIQNEEGLNCKEPKEILRAFVDYYQHMLGSTSATDDVLKHVVEAGKRVNRATWDAICRIPSEEDIRAIIYALPDEKNPRPYGYTSKIYKST